eukprot:TCALIF_05315-PC protein Name:"Similar to Cp1 Cathepsin L (Drosophila melanogaster)" AED:0.20 eAED:0.21 QI:41/0.45/0.33/1/0.54/0.5/12/28/835
MVFMENKYKSIRHNYEAHPFGDLLHHEFVQQMNGYRIDLKERSPGGATFSSPANVELPDEVVTPVKNQDQFGSCWAFLATGALEDQPFREECDLISLSEQNLIDCSEIDGNSGCSGGTMDFTFQYIKENHGIDTKATYPRVSNLPPRNRGASDVGFVDLPKNDEQKLKGSVATVGPVSVTIDASRPMFQFYSHGIYDDKHCHTSTVDHAVLVVGYGTDNGSDYWSVKNSWGHHWEESGVLLALTLLLGSASAVSFFEVVVEEWESWKFAHAQNYSSPAEEKFRMKVFMENKAKVAKHNNQAHRGQHTYFMKMNKYGDLLHHEFTNLMNGYRMDLRKKSPVGATFISPANVELPTEVDWRTKGAVTPVKDQGQCGSCWAFSATGSLEGQHFRKNGKMVSLSEQNLLDCSTSYGNEGCGGGLMDFAFTYVKDNGGIDTETGYPYEGQDESCRYQVNTRGATDKGFVDVPKGDEGKLKEAVATIGPVSVAIDASKDSFQFYSHESNMKVVLTFGVLLATASALTSLETMVDEWEAWKLAHGQNYSTSNEERFRMKVFIENKDKIARHNHEAHRGIHTYFLKMNKFGDLLRHEFVNVMNGYRIDLDNSSRMGATFISPANVELPNEVDWRAKGAVTPIKDQGRCGSCWAFSATGSLEGQHFRKNGQAVSLSEQNLMDCSIPYGNIGCAGGLMDGAFKYIKENGGIDTEKAYPYEGALDDCRYQVKTKGASDMGFVDLPKGDEQKLKEAVATTGPVSVAVDASHETFQFYSHGVYDEPHCRPDAIDHGVVVVGYGSENGTDFWLVKNSWGTKWGDAGFIKMTRNKQNQCGIATKASYPLV